MYHQLAHLYDWPGSLEFADKAMEKIQAVFAQRGIQPGAQILDLACGTGTLAIRLAEQGYNLIGIDCSLPMLDQAQKKPGADKIAWHQDDMRSFLLDESLHGQIDVVLCLYDSLNHLSNETELRATFFQVAKALKPSGLFLFDLNTLENYQTFWNGTDRDEGPNYRLHTDASFNADTCKARVQFTVDEHTEEGLVRQSEVLHEQYFDEFAVQKYLEASGFWGISHEGFNPVAEVSDSVTLKTFWQAIKS